MSTFWWVVFPYLALMLLIVGSIYRYKTGQRGWGSKSSQILEKRLLRVGSLLFHWGILCVIGGHVMGLIVPLSVYHFLGLPDEWYHMTAIVFGGAAGVAAWAGCLLLIIRRTFNQRVRVNSSVSDHVALWLLFLVLTLGVAMTLGYNTMVGPYEYRTTVGPWFRSIVLLHPNAALMAHVPLLLQVHVVLSFVLFAVWPFCRLIHVWSAPVGYPMRPPIQYRSRS